MHRALRSALAAALLWGGAELIGIPTVPYTSTGSGQFSLANVKSIVVDFQYATTVDSRGSTLIPPTLQQFAGTFASDLLFTTGNNVSVVNGSAVAPGSIFLTLDAPTHYLDVAKRPTSEGYSLTVDSNGITIKGASPLGAWWGTRTVLQQAVLNNGSIPYGSGADAPGWATRGMMLDVGRHFYPKEFIIEMCAYMSFFKQNTFHLHLSDNLFVSTRYTREKALSLYARFRLWSDDQAVAGLNNFKNESYTREDFDEIQALCAARGVTILPELESPGHSLVIVQWRPQIGYTGDLSLLNLSHPDALPTMQTIWSAFLPWFHTDLVSIGADEYGGGQEDYDAYVNAINEYIGSTSGKRIRIWGTYPPNFLIPGYDNIDTNVSIQHWEYFEDNPLYDYISNNYSVLNSNDDFYIVDKWSPSYPQTIDVSETFVGSPRGGPWYPYIFEMSNRTDNPARSNPLVEGAIAPIWNDYGPAVAVYSEAYYAWRDGLPALADKHWGGNLTQAQFGTILSALQARIPGQNLDRAIPSKSAVIFNYTTAGLNASSPAPVVVRDASPNGYDAQSDCPVSASGTLEVSANCSLATPLSSKGRDYTLTLSLMVTSLDSPTNATLITGRDSSLMLTPAVTLFASGTYYRLTTGLALGEWTDLSIVGKGNQTFAFFQRAGEASRTREEFIVSMDINGQYVHEAPMAIEAPLSQVGGAGCGWAGELRGMSLSSQAEY